MKPDQLVTPIVDRPSMAWGSDAIAELLDRLDFPYLAMVPGSSYRGLHDSLVNYLGNEGPQLIVCLHEEHSVAIAQGYAKVTGEPMLVALHSNVGLMHAAMAIYNAYCDRAPMIILGATGPVDAAKRRPWTDWVHTAADQGAIVRDYVKWDDQPASVQAALDSIVRGNVYTRALPSAPVYVNLDTELQEDELDPAVVLPEPADYPVPVPPALDGRTVAELLGRIREAERPLLLLGRMSRSTADWDQRVALAEALGACVLTDLRMPAAFPTDHPLHPARPSAGRLSPSGYDLVRGSDLIIALNWTELEGLMRRAFGDEERPFVVSCRDQNALLNGWVKDQYTMAKADLELTAAPDQVVQDLLYGADESSRPQRDDWPPAPAPEERERPVIDGDPILMEDLALALADATVDIDVSYTYLPLGWSSAVAFTHPADYLGRDGGGGLGSGPGVAVGAALALDGTGRLPIAVLGDGDTLMGSSALWTAAHYRLPLVVIVANNRSYHNDEKHQQAVAERRGRPVENRSVGQHLRDPDPDLVGIARGHGLTAFGPIVERDDLDRVIAKAISEATAGGPVLVDVHVDPHGYGRG